MKTNILTTISFLFLFLATAVYAEEGKVDVNIQGFRSAHFGMTQNEVLKAIHKDFKISKSEVRKGINPLEKTKTLSITLKDLLPESGKSWVVYIFGYKSKKLIQVNIIWGNPVVDDANGEVLVSTANMLGKYFSGLGFDPKTSIVNRPLKDGSILVFQSIDKHMKMVRLILNNPKEQNKGKNSMSLQLSYVENPKAPDIFMIKKGSF